MITDEIKLKIEDIINKNKIVLFMKGSIDKPADGFSEQIVYLLCIYSVKFKAIDIQKDLELKEAIKDFSNWPTFPQLYINGEFIGGSDVIAKLHEQGKLETILENTKL